MSSSALGSALPAVGIHQLFAQQVERAPHATALVFRGGTLSYGELDARANQVASRLLQLGLAPEERVGVCIERSPELVIALLAVLKAGGAYLPFDPSYPEERVRFMLRDGGVNTLLTVRPHAPHGAELANVVCLDEGDEFGRASNFTLQAHAGGRRLAYVCYTSGSTGVPKGVEVTHEGVIRLVHQVSYVQLDDSRVLLHAAPAAFDATTFELWGALLHGGRVVLFPPDVPTAATIQDVVQSFGVTTAFLTTALVNAIVDEDPQSFRGISQLLFGGEAVSVSHILRLQAACPDLEIVHVYGPTETTTFATSYAVRERLRPEQTTIPIGKPIEHTTLHVLGHERAPVPVGEVGELYIGGPGVARGYLGRPELSAARFLDDPTGAEGARLYRSGDLVRMLPSGDLVFMGRVDHQVKIRGHRIELGEIECRLSALPDVSEAVVLCREDRPGDKRLVAYVVPQAGQQLLPSRLRQQLAVELPGYMVPNFYVRLDRFPLTPNSKIDRTKLPLPMASDAEREQEYRAPERAVERDLVALWESLLGVQPIGTRDDFFQLGGHSLLAMQLLSRIRDSFGVELPLAVLFARSTVEATAPLVEAVLYLTTENVEPTADFGELTL